MFSKNSLKLKKSYFYQLLVLVILVTLINSLVNNSSSLSLAKEKESKEINVVVNPANPKQGDTLSVKIEKKDGKTRKPRVFFDKTKYETYEISEKWYRALVPIKASDKSGKHELNVYYAGKGKDIDLTVGTTNYKTENIVLSGMTSGLMITPIERKKVNQALFTKTDKKLWKGKFAYPCEGKLSTPYGVKRTYNGVGGPNSYHKGLDFAVPKGTSVKAPEDGKVVVAGYNKKGFVVNGNCVFLDHGHGLISAYLHLSEISVKEGQLVKKGQLLGKVGSTGISTGPHLHWGVYVHGKPIEPELWVKTAID